jgi:hypothetical protein
MKKETREPGKVLPLEECIKVMEGTLEVARDRYKRSRGVKSKRSAACTLEIFESTVYHLERSREKAGDPREESVLNN